MKMIDVNEDLNKCAQCLTIGYSVDRDGWKKVVDAATVL